MHIHPLVLASGSRIRKSILLAAGLGFEVQKPDVDEQSIKDTNQDLSPQDLAILLAETKALSIKKPKNVLIIGADQILEVDGKSLDKCTNMKDAKNRLWMLRGRSHFLTGGVVLAQNEHILWRRPQRSELTMRKFTEQELDTYLQKAGSQILHSVGCYELEGLGIGLFASLKGDHTAMLGLEIISLLKALREHKGLSL